MENIIKLNLGAGPEDRHLPGYINLDRKTGQEIYPLDLPDGYADVIRASHVLEHFSHRDVRKVLTDWVRVLKPGGIIKIAVPDFDIICTQVVNGAAINAQGYLMGGHIDDDDHHGALFNMHSLCSLFYDLGMKDVRVWDSDAEDCSSLPISLNLQARKPVADVEKYTDVAFVLSQPRYGPSEHHTCIDATLRRFEGCRIHKVSGCFWHQQLCNAMEAEIAVPECKYVCTLDYDSLWSPDDAMQLYQIMETHPEIDALVPLQQHRGMPHPLFTMRGPDGKPLSQIDPGILDGLVAPICTGHFGLTFIRAETLRALPRPWMVGKPAEDGTWGEGHIDPDIHFWFNWEQAGNTVYLANQVVIGHIQDMILWTGKNLETVTQRVTDYIKYGKPKEAR